MADPYEEIRKVAEDAREAYRLTRNGSDQLTRNGSGSVTYKWVVGVAVLACLSFGGWVWSSTLDRVLDLERTSQARSERLAKVETEVDTLKEQLKRIEDKLDLALARR